MGRTSRWAARAAASVLLAGVGLVATAGPAAASLDGWEVVGDDSALDSNPKLFGVDCPANTVVISAGSYLVVGAPSMAGKVGMDSLRLRADGSGADFGWHEADGNYLTSWRTAGVLVCATKPVGYEYAEAASVDSSDPGRKVEATCPTPGRKVIGAGGYLTGGGAGQVFLDAVVPNATSATAHARETQVGTGSDWQVHATVICADPPRGWTLDSSTPAADSDDSYGGQQVCAGQQIIGGGFALNNANGQVLFTGWHIFDSSDVPTTASYSAHEDVTGYGAAWSMTKYKICVDE